MLPFHQFLFGEANYKPSNKLKEISAGAALNVDAQVVSGFLSAGLLSTDGKIIYRIEDGIPVLLPEEGIATLQFTDFPRG